MATETDTQLHGGRLIARALRAQGVTKLFTLSGGHLFSIYDGCRAEGIDIVDVRHEQTAAFAAEGWAKVTRELGVCALTAGPGVTNGMSAIASASENHSPVLVLGGRAPALRWGQGSLQEMDHVPFVAPLVKFAATPDSTAEIPELLDRAMRERAHPALRSRVPRLPASTTCSARRRWARTSSRCRSRGSGPAADAAAIERAASPAARRRAAGDHGRHRALLGPGRGGSCGLWPRRCGSPCSSTAWAAAACPPTTSCSSPARARTGSSGADVALVIGVPLDFRLGFGGAFGESTQVIMIDVAEPAREAPARRWPSASTARCRPRSTPWPSAAADGSSAPERDAWVASLRAVETEKRAAEAAELADPRAPLHPMRIYGELAGMLDRDAIVIGDGGDFVSYAGRVVDSYRPGCWLDPGPFGCLGTGPGYALAAKLAHPERQVVLLLGDGAFGFSGMEFDTLARHGVHVVGVIGNNGIWALEKHPMEFLYGYSVAAELRPETRYDQMVAGAGRPRRAGPRARRAAPGPGAGLCRRRRRRWSTCSPTRASPTRAGPTWPSRLGAARRCAPGLRPERKPPARAGGFRSRFGPIGTGRGTCLTGPF